MSDRSSFRGASSRGTGRGGGSGGGGRGGYARQTRGGGASHPPHPQQPQSQQEKPKKENILDLTKYMDKEVNVKFNGGRESIYFLAAFLFASLSIFKNCLVCSSGELWLLPQVLIGASTRHGNMKDSDQNKPLKANL